MTRILMTLLVSLFLAAPLAAQEAAGAPQTDRSATGGAQTLDDILARQRGEEIDDSFRSGATGNPDNAAGIANQLGTLGGTSDSEVWRALREIPAGETRSYGQLATALGRPGSSRAVARANGANQIAVMIPCHRVLGADGTLTGYGGGLWRKQRLIEIERALSQPSAA